MRFIWIRAFSLMMTLLLVLSACSRSDGANEIFKYDIAQGIKTLDPQFATDETARMVISNTFEGLFRQHPDGSVESGLAESYEISPDGLTYTFKLRTDAKWRLPSNNSDYVPIYAADFVFAFQRIFNPDAPSPFTSSLQSIKNSYAVLNREKPLSALGVTADGTHTLIITLERRETMLPTLLASSYAMPCNETFFYGTKGRYGLDAMMLAYNGPFRISRLDNESGISLRRNPAYYGEVVAAGVEFNIPTAIAKTAENNFVSDRVQRFLNETTDACKIDASLVQQVVGNGGTITAFEDTVWVLALNTNKTKFESVDMRQAIAYSIDRSLFTPDIPRYMRATNTLIPPALSMNGHPFRELAGNSSPLAYSPDLASRSYQKAMKDLGQFSFGQILIMDDPSQAVLAGYVQRTLQQYISSPVGITRLEPEDLKKRVRSGDYSAAILPLTAEYASPAALLDYFRAESSSNFTGFKNEKFDALLEEISSLPGQEQVEAYSQAEQLLLTECPVIPLYYETSFFGAANGVTGIEFAPFLSGLRFANARKST